MGASDETDPCFGEGAAAQEEAPVPPISVSSGAANTMNTNMPPVAPITTATVASTTTTMTTGAARSISTSTTIAPTNPLPHAVAVAVAVAATQMTVAVDVGSTGSVAPTPTAPPALALQSSQESSSDRLLQSGRRVLTKRRPMDVLSLKGVGAGISAGNNLFRAYVAANKKDFVRLPINGGSRMFLVQYIADNLAKVGTRFLKKNTKGSFRNDRDLLWEVMSPDMVTLKIKHALRDFQEKMAPQVLAHTNMGDASTILNQAQSPNGFLNMDKAEWTAKLAPLLIIECSQPRPNVKHAPSITPVHVVPSSKTPTPTPTHKKTTFKRKNASTSSSSMPNTSPSSLVDSPVILNSKRQRRVTQKITDNVESTGTLYNAIPAENLRPDAVRHNKQVSNSNSNNNINKNKNNTSKSSPSPKKKKVHSSPSPISVAKTKDRQRVTQHLSAGKHPTSIITTTASEAAAADAAAKIVSAAPQSALKQVLKLPKILTSQRPPPSSSLAKKRKKQQNVPNKKNAKQTNSSGNASNATLSELMKNASKYLHPYARILIQQMLVSKDVQGALAILNRDQVTSQRPDAICSESEREKRIRHQLKQRFLLAMQARIDPKIFMERLLYCMSDGTPSLQISAAVVNSK